MKVGSSSRVPLLSESGSISRPHLTLAMSDYGHVQDVMTGRIQPEGIVLTPLTLPIEEIFYRHLVHGEFDVAETSFAKYLTLVASGDQQFVGIPVFPSRVFRHSAIYVRAGSGIRDAKSLEGRRVGIPEWAQTAGVFVRGLLVERYGVSLESIKWVQAGVNEPGRVEKVSFDLPPALRYEPRPRNSLDEMLLSGEIDAAITARPPKSFERGLPGIERLFPDFRAQEKAYYDATSIFPIMHVLTVRRSVLEAYPWVARSLLRAFEASKDATIGRMRDVAASHVPLPWIAAFTAEATAMTGGDLWPYGVDANAATLDAFCRFAHDQHLTPTLLTGRDLFPDQLLSQARV